MCAQDHLKETEYKKHIEVTEHGMKLWGGQKQKIKNAGKMGLAFKGGILPKWKMMNRWRDIIVAQITDTAFHLHWKKPDPIWGCFLSDMKHGSYGTLKTCFETYRTMGVWRLWRIEGGLSDKDRRYRHLKHQKMHEDDPDVELHDGNEVSVWYECMV
jgi:hypothetical protein